ncbi:MAG: YlzJ-like family protein, partial [Caldanaerobacter sp.]|uniref:YlzJ-like family protein n=1 Tax=Caldanaerobacter sp. TaxID=2930036 RepID=UPI003C75B1C8
MLYTIIPYEVIFEKKEEYTVMNYSELKLGNKTLLVERLSEGKYLIRNMFSTNPYDYLDKSYSPGNIIFL